MIATLASLIFSLSINPSVGFAGETIYMTARFSEPVLGVVCFQAESVSDDADIKFRESCEDINGYAKQLRWKNWPRGEYRVRATFRGANIKLDTAYQRLYLKPALGDVRD